MERRHRQGRAADPHDDRLPWRHAAAQVRAARMPVPSRAVRRGMPRIAAADRRLGTCRIKPGRGRKWGGPGPARLGRDRPPAQGQRDQQADQARQVSAHPDHDIGDRHTRQIRPMPQRPGPRGDVGAAERVTDTEGRRRGRRASPNPEARQSARSTRTSPWCRSHRPEAPLSMSGLVDRAARTAGASPHARPVSRRRSRVGRSRPRH